MPLYHIVFALLLVGAVWEHIQKRTPRGLYIIAFAVLTAMLCLRFGQGTDYFSYANIYHNLPANPLAAIRVDHIHSEIGWKALCGAFRWMGFSFPAFIMVLSGYMMVLFGRFLRMYGGQRKMLALLICYHTLYLTYFSSVLRQGIVAATFLGLLLPMLIRRDYVKYYVISAALLLIHSVAAVLLVLPLLRGIQLKFRHLVTIAVIGFLLGVVFSLVDIGVILSRFLPIVYLGGSDVSLVALCERIATFAVVCFCYYVYLQGNEPSQNDKLFIVFKVYAIGVFLYNILMWSALISSRTVYFFKVVEVVLLCACIGKTKRSRALVLAYCIVLSLVMYVKNLDSYLEQANYHNASVADFPYVSIFNREDILDYRSDIIDYPFP